MRRHPELAAIACALPEVQDAAHIAIDKLTAVGLLSNQINRQENDAVKEIELCERMNDLLSEAHYYWQSYMSLKLKRYEQLLREENVDQWHSLKRIDDNAADELKTRQGEV